MLVYIDDVRFSVESIIGGCKNGSGEQMVMMGEEKGASVVS